MYLQLLILFFYFLFIGEVRINSNGDREGEYVILATGAAVHFLNHQFHVFMLSLKVVAAPREKI
jgi:hypothetical protein